MGRDALEQRANWQEEASVRGYSAEKIFRLAMQQHLEQSGVTLVRQPHDLRRIYGQQGVIPDFRFHNEKTSKSVFVEIKRQRAAGNAHERACKYMMPGILNAMRRAANQDKSVIPFWWVFTNGIATDVRYRQEIQCWFQGMEAHLLLWQNTQDSTAVTEHFEEHILPLLE